MWNFTFQSVSSEPTAPAQVSSAHSVGVTSRQAAREAQRIPCLDGIRAASFLVVFGNHALASWLPGQLGVTIFFFLSGYLITTLMRAEYEKHSSVNLGHFWLRRALRILPPLYVMVLGSTLLALTFYPPGTVHPRTVAAQLLLYANYYDGDRPVPGTAVVWSLAVEEHFYLLFPLLYVSMQRWGLSSKQQAWLLWSLCAAAMLWRCVLVLGMHAPTSRIYSATDTRIDSILFGCALAVRNNPALDSPRLASNTLKYLLVPLAVVVLWASVYAGSSLLADTWSFSVQGAALTVLFVAAIRFPDWAPFRALSWRPMVFIGLLSYSLYLVHDVVLQLVVQVWKLPHATLRAAAALAVSTTVAWVIFQLLERPCARARRRLTAS